VAGVGFFVGKLTKLIILLRRTLREDEPHIMGSSKPFFRIERITKKFGNFDWNKERWGVSGLQI